MAQRGAALLFVGEDVEVVLVLRVEVLTLDVGKIVLLGARADQLLLVVGNVATLVRGVIHLNIGRDCILPLVYFRCLLGHYGRVCILADGRLLAQKVAAAKHHITIADSNTTICCICLRFKLQIRFSKHTFLRLAKRFWHLIHFRLLGLIVTDCDLIHGILILDFHSSIIKQTTIKLCA